MESSLDSRSSAPPTARPSPMVRPADLAIVGLTVLAPALGGATELWAQVLLGVGCVVLLLLAPPRSSAGWVLPTVSLGLIVLALSSFLPTALFGKQPWLQLVIGKTNLELPETLTPQPWLSLERTLLLAFGLLWMNYLVSRSWITRRRVLLGVYAAGIAVLAAVALLGLVLDAQPPFWHPAGPFGFFPNRNQTANVLALGAIITLALAFHDFARKRELRFLWAGGYLLLGVAVVLDGSRSGVLLFLGGSFLWAIWTGWSRRELKYLSLGASVVFLGLTLFCLFGGKTLDRFSHLPEKADDRILMQTDALRLLQDGSWHGIGLGNFPPVFSHYRKSYLHENRPIHPESDWLWLGIEAGWIAPLLAAAALGYWMIRNFPRPSQADFRLRAAAWVAVAGFALHGLVDVSGHRMGSLWPALFLLAMLADDRPVLGTSRWAPNVYRGLGAALGLVVLGWAVSLLPLDTFPTSASFERLKGQVKSWQSFRADAGVLRLTTEALRFAPLDWELYFGRALAEVRVSEDFTPAMADFDRALHLEQNSSAAPFVEGVAWLARQPQLALGAWNEALHRAAASGRPDAMKEKRALYDRMLSVAEPFPEIRDEVRALALDDHDLMIVFMRHATREEFLIELQRMLLEDPDLKALSQGQRATVFSLWSKHGDRDQLEQQLLAKPEWLEAGWLALASIQASREEFLSACGLAERFAPRPVLPHEQPMNSVPELKSIFLTETNDFSTGYLLYTAEMQAQQTNDALIVLQRVTRQPDCPGYFNYLEAQLWTARGSWPEAWQAWLRYCPPERQMLEEGP